ncbi:DUF4468 domain-containing protein [Pedobacter sp. L105]|uniref:DUF4468 domain-containing protein n=1 Tax=Pedobacter sp. L105 TaxID=1641871 RepID=UPI00131CD185|nr:DUF4468 domain-containing protein [Pedobacter sp. L105]
MYRLTFLLLLLPFLSFSQTDTTGTGFPFEDGKIVYESAAAVSGLSRDTLYAAAKKWIAHSFADGKFKLEHEDSGTGQIQGSAVSLLLVTSSNWLFQTYALELNFSIEILCKDEHYQIRFYGITTKSVALGSMTSDVQVPLETLARQMKETKFKPKQTERNRDMKRAVDEQFSKLLSSFQQGFKKSGSLF